MSRPFLSPGRPPGDGLKPFLSGCLLLAGSLLPGCSYPAAQEPPADPPAEIGSRFDPTQCGTITGEILWTGAVPDVPPFRAPYVPRPESGVSQGRFTWPNQRAPVVVSGKLTSAVVFLKGIDPQRSRPWDHDRVTVEIEKHQLLVHQGNLGSHFGFVQRGRDIEMITRDTFFHSIQARGAAFFSMPFADPNVSRTRRLDRPGIVELSSGCGAFWMTGFLFVEDHPYLARLDTQGRFTLPRVPAGTYQLVCWHPSWIEVSRELDGDTWEVASLEYQSPLTVEHTITLEAGKTETVELVFSAPK